MSQKSDLRLEQSERNQRRKVLRLQRMLKFLDGELTIDKILRRRWQEAKANKPNAQPDVEKPQPVESSDKQQKESNPPTENLVVEKKSVVKKKSKSKKRESKRHTNDSIRRTTEKRIPQTPVEESKPTEATKLRRETKQKKKLRHAEPNVATKNRDKKQNKTTAKKQKKKSSQQKSAPVILIAPPIEGQRDPLHPETWNEKLAEIQQSIVNSDPFALGVSFYANALILIILTVLFIQGPVEEPPIMITASFTDPDAETREDSTVVMPAKVEEEQPDEVEPEPEPQPDPEPEPDPVQATEPEPVVDATDVVIEKPIEVAVVEKPIEVVEMPVVPIPLEKQKPVKPKVVTRSAPSEAVSQGSFSAWTEPQFPSPGQPYTIVIQVTLPERIKRYPATDLSGVIVGADGYRKVIRLPKGNLPIEDHTVRVHIPIIGAERGLKDSIVVQSRLLRERQIIELNFLSAIIPPHAALAP